MYLPLRFLEQTDNYFQLPATRNMETFVNAMSLKFVTDLLVTEYDFINRTHAMMRDYYSGSSRLVPADVVKRWETFAQRHTVAVRAIGPQGADFVNYIVYVMLRNDWRKNKVAYRVESQLVDTLIEMKSNKLCSVECVLNLPSNCFYIDWEDIDPFTSTGKASGCLVNMHKSNGDVIISIIVLLDDKRCGTIMSTVAVFGITDDIKSVQLTAGDAAEELVLDAEDGTKYTYYERKFKKFFLNFLVYLYAANNDVEVSAKTAGTYKPRKATKEPQNKFKEVNGFDVGFRYAKMRKEKVTYVGSTNTTSDTKHGTPKSTHYRSAHWHSYWRTVDGERKLIVHWIEGMIVNGVEAKDVVIKKIPE